MELPATNKMKLYKVIGLLGKGAQGEVKLVKRKSDGKEFAMKITGEMTIEESRKPGLMEAKIASGEKEA